jgi:hypothetical protein
MRIIARLEFPIIVYLAIAVLWGAGCAKIGEPLPPTIQIPEPATDLAVEQVSDHIVLKATKPAKNMNGSAALTIRSLEIYRLAEKVSNATSAAPVTAEIFTSRAAPIFSISSDRFSDYLNGNSFVIEDKLALPNRSEIYTHLFRYAVLFVNNKNQAAGFSNQVSIAPTPIPLPPSGLSYDVTESFIRLKWTPPEKNMNGSSPAHIAGYKIFRSEDAQKFPDSPLNSDLVVNPGFRDEAFQFDKTYYYKVILVGSLKNPYAESLPSATLEVTAKDIFPPEPPEKFNAIPDNGVIYLLWVPSPSKDVVGCRIYRREAGKPEKQLLQNELITTPSFQDDGVKPDQQYEYLATAVDAHGNESAAVRAIVQTPK